MVADEKSHDEFSNEFNDEISDQDSDKEFYNRYIEKDPETLRIIEDIKRLRTEMEQDKIEEKQALEVSQKKKLKLDIAEKEKSIIEKEKWLSEQEQLEKERLEHSRQKEKHKRSAEKEFERLTQLESKDGTAIEIGVYRVKSLDTQSLTNLAKQIMEPLHGNYPFSIVPQLASKSIFIVSVPVLVKKTISVLTTLDSCARSKDYDTGFRDEYTNFPESDYELELEEIEKQIGKTTHTRNAKDTLQAIEEIQRLKIEIAKNKSEYDKKQQKVGNAEKLQLQEDLIKKEQLLEKKEQWLQEKVRWLENQEALFKKRQREEHEYDESFEADLPIHHIKRTKFQVHKLKFQNGKEIQTSLKKIGKSLETTGTSNTELINAISTLEWIEPTNSLIYSGTNEAMIKLDELIETLDIPTKEVFIEMLIIETSVVNSLTFGTKLGFRHSNKSQAGILGFQGATLNDSLDSLSTTPDASSLIGQDNFTLGVIGKVLTHNNTCFSSLGALVNALHSDSDASIVMNPQIITENGSPAELFVGHTDQFPSSTISGGDGNFITQNYEYKKVGARLKITPTIGNSDIITLDIDQELSSSDDTDNNDISDEVKTILSTRTTKTRVHVPNKYFLIISGMISEEKTRQKSRVPCLGAIPIASAAFSNTRRSEGKRNLMIFIRPHIVTTPEEMQELTRNKKHILEYRKDRERSNNFELQGLLDFLELKDSEY